MPVTTYRIFLASPGDLQTERRLVREVVSSFTGPAAFTVEGWEGLGVGLGNAQQQILDCLRECDYLILLLAARWGSAPGGDGEYTSGTEAEFYEAVKHRNDAARPMRDISVFFRAVPPAMLADPGPQLQRVVEFRKHLEGTQQIFFGTFDETGDLRRRIETQLSNWAQALVRGEPKRAAQPIIIARPGNAAAARELTRADADSLIRAGRFTEAETVYAQLTASEADLGAMIGYGRFMRNQGRFAQASGMLTRVVELAELQQDTLHQAVALENLSSIERRRYRLADAEALSRRALALYQSLAGRDAALGTARAWSKLGIIHRMKGQYEEALQAHELSERLFLEQLDFEGLAKQHTAKGKVCQAQNRLEIAEQFYLKAFDALLKLPLCKEAAVVAGHLASTYLSQGKLDRAEEMCRLSLKYNRDAGDKWGLATCDRYLGWLALERGDLVEARRLLEQAAQSYTRMGIVRDLEETRVLLARLDAPQPQL